MQRFAQHDATGLDKREVGIMRWGGYECSPHRFVNTGIKQPLALRFPLKGGVIGGGLNIPRWGVSLRGDQDNSVHYAGSVPSFIIRPTRFQRHQLFQNMQGQVDFLVQSAKFRQHFIAK